jgi:hypothetical protein
MGKYLSHTETHHSVPCPPPNQSGVGILCLETILDGNRALTFLSQNQQRYPCRCNRDPLEEAGRHCESVILWETCWGHL